MWNGHRYVYRSENITCYINWNLTPSLLCTWREFYYVRYLPPYCGLSCDPPARYVEGSTLRTNDCDTGSVKTWLSGLHTWWGWALDPWEGQTQTDARKPCDRAEGDAAASWALPGTAGCRQKLGRGRRGCPGAFRGRIALPTLWALNFGLWTRRQKVRVAWHHHCRVIFVSPRKCIPVSPHSFFFILFILILFYF